MIELNRKYTGKELAENLFEIKPNTFRKSKDKYLQYMSEFFEWHKEGSKYMLTKQLKEYVPKEKGRRSTKEQTEHDYRLAVHRTLQQESWGTGASVARSIVVKDEYMRDTYHHSLRTSYNYSQPYVSHDYSIAEKKWKGYDGGLDYYIEMTDDELAEWKELINACFGNKHDISLEQDLAVMHEQGDIDDRDYQLALAKINDNKYQAALTAWKAKYGYTPIRVNKYVENEDSRWEVLQLEMKKKKTSN